MIAVIFEVTIADGKKQEYLDLAGRLKPLLGEVDGFISIERFSSHINKNKILSLSFWRDEESVKSWRNKEKHRLAQIEGRNGIFNDYRLRVAKVSRDYGMNKREEVPVDSKSVHS